MRLAALATALALLVLLAPPATAGNDCCERSCDGVCCLLMERAGLDHAHSASAAASARGSAPRAPSWKPAPRLDRDAETCPATCASSSVSRTAPASVGDRGQLPSPPAVSTSPSPLGLGHRAAPHRGGASPRGPPTSSRA